MVAHAAPTPYGAVNTDFSSLSYNLKQVRGSISNLEKRILSALKNQKDGSKKLTEFKQLADLHEKEGKLSRLRLKELEGVVKTLEERQSQLRKRILEQQKEIRGFIKEILKSEAKSNLDPKQESTEGPRRRALSRLAILRAQEIETLKVDLVDAEMLEERIDHERSEVAYTLNDLKEREAILEFHRKLQYDTFKKHVQDRVVQLEQYNRLKSSQNQIEGLIQQFNSRVEFDRIEQQEKQASAAMLSGGFIKFKGKLPFPVAEGKVQSHFGKSTDPRLNVPVFKKGIDIAAGQGKNVRAIFPGRVVYSGQLPGYKNVTIIDHGAHYYSLMGNLGALVRKVGDRVSTGDAVGVTDEKGMPLYFEIRSRNVAVNPLQWVVN